MSNSVGQNQAPREQYQGVSEIPPPSKTSQENINMKNKAGCNYVTHKHEVTQKQCSYSHFSLIARTAEWNGPASESPSPDERPREY